MPTSDLLTVATGGHGQVPSDWMPASQVRPFVFEDPALVWLNYHGHTHGFKRDESPYDFLTFIGDRGRQFERKWTAELAPAAVRVCQEPLEVRSADKVRETLQLMQQGVPVIAQPALWWAPARVYGVPDLLVHTSWVIEKFPELLTKNQASLVAPSLARDKRGGHYVVLDIKFTTKLDQTDKKKDLGNYAAQVRIYSYMLGHLQGLMPANAYIVTRDRILDPLPIHVGSALGQGLDGDLAAIRDWFVDIKLNGADYVPWEDTAVASNYKNDVEQWRTAKHIIASEKTPGRDPCLLYRITPPVREQLNALGYGHLDSLLSANPEAVPFEQCAGIGATYAKQMRCILRANGSETCMLPAAHAVPAAKPFEFFVDFEYFTNVNVDFEAQWPTLDGCEMVFMIGVGRNTPDGWRFTTVRARAEDHGREREMFEEFLGHLVTETNGIFADAEATAIYHWTSAEVWQSKRAGDRHALAADHRLRNLPWVDLQKIFLNGPCAIPGAWDYSLKPIAKALGQLDASYDPHWPGDLDEGLRAMVMGWKAYAASDPLQSPEMTTLTQYLEADCRALRNLLAWLRSQAE